MSLRAALLFPSHFLWGTATSSHQVEGNNTNNDWWEWEQQGKINDGSISGMACDHYNRFEEDFKALQEQHHNTHRLSLEWSRIEPEQGRFNREAVEHYRAVIRSLQGKGIKPMLTLHHFTNPLWLSRQGGWEQPEIIALFERYVQFVVRELGKGIELWITINEPIIYAYFGYITGVWPPGKIDFSLAMRVIKHMLLAHGRAYHAIHNLLGSSCQVSIAKHLCILDPYRSLSFPDRTASLCLDFIFNRLFIKACLSGVIPPPVALFRRIPWLKNTLDFIGVNYYSREMLKADFKQANSFFISLLTKNGAPTNSLGEEIYPLGLFRFLKRLKKYKKPIYITENGTTTQEDTQRARYLVGHLKQVHKAISKGIDVRGYYYWSAMDNFEWAKGYAARFGLMQVDYQTQQRTLRPSGKLYAEIAKRGVISQDIINRVLQ
jgi:beta-glucosidase